LPRPFGFIQQGPIRREFESLSNWPPASFKIIPLEIGKNTHVSSVLPLLDAIP